LYISTRQRDASANTHPRLLYGRSMHAPFPSSPLHFSRINHSLDHRGIATIVKTLSIMKLACTKYSSRKIIRLYTPSRTYPPKHYQLSLPETVWRSHSHTPSISRTARAPPPSHSLLSLGMLRDFAWKPRSVFETISTANDLSHSRSSQSTSP
jgi:hypothetical protein